MQFGANSFIWVSPFSMKNLPALLVKVRKMGFDVFEVAVEDPSLNDTALLKKEIEAAGLKPIICGAFGPDRNICSADPAVRENAKKYILWLIDAAETVSSDLVTGPMYSSVGKDHLEDPQARKAEWDLSVRGIREMAEYAEKKGVKIALETLNRFETDMINTVDQGLQFVSEVGKDNVGLHLDTFHMNLEEKSSANAIRKAGKANKIFHFHSCENDRGTPGTGQVHWKEIAAALKDVKYNGPVVIESFTPEVKEIARAVNMWREVAPDQDTIAREGVIFLKELLK
jgi:D-psicose/D-tagatose/L-ribulose 3-epimerase